MKTMKNYMMASLIGAMGLICTESANAQMSDYKFNQLFEQALAEILAGNHGQAVPMLEQMNASGREHAQVQYLLGMCLVKTGQTTSKEQALLEKAVMRYDFYHQFGRIDDATSPALAWFFLGEVYAGMGNNRKAIEAYRTYMSCIPLASLDHKRSVIEKIDRLKTAGPATAASGPSLLANRQP